MPISISKYVSITSSLGGTPAVQQRSLSGRIFTTNPLVPTDSFIEFTNTIDIGNYFGTTSEEYLRAVLYFSFISKNGLSPQLLSYARVTLVNTPPEIFGGEITLSLSDLELITNGSFTLTLGSSTNLIGALNFTGISSFADAATIIQTTINAQSGLQWTAATVSYDAARGGFDFFGGDPSTPDSISVSPGTVGTDIATIMGWLPQSINGSQGAIWSDGLLAQTITETLANSASESDNFGSFVFTTSSGVNSNPALVLEATIWNDSQNVLYQFMVPVTNYTTAQLYGTPETGTLINYAGSAITLSPLSTEYPEMLPMMVLAATNYNNDNAVQNYMFQQGPFTPSVTDTVTSNNFDSISTNYYGVTQTAGSLLAFYQRGILTGNTNDPTDMGVYADEQWLKSYITFLLMNLLVSLPAVSASKVGIGQLTSTFQSAIDLALSNGTIVPSQTFTTVQQSLITTLSGDNTAYFQVQSLGYWYNIKIVPVSIPVPQYQAQYLLIYGKNNAVRSVQGTDILI